MIYKAGEYIPAGPPNRKNEMKNNEQLRECINSGQVSAAQVVAHAENGEVEHQPKPSIHAGSGAKDTELSTTPTGWPAALLQDDSRQLSKALSRDPNARALAREAVAHQEAEDNIEYFVDQLKSHIKEFWEPLPTAVPLVRGILRLYAKDFAASSAALAAEQAEVARLKKALDRIANLDPVMDSEEGFNEWGEADCFNQAQNIAKAALTAPGEKHE